MSDEIVSVRQSLGGGQISGQNLTPTPVTPKWLFTRSLYNCAMQGRIDAHIEAHIEAHKSVVCIWPVSLDTSPKSEPALELLSRAVPIVEAHHRSVGPDTGRNSRVRRIKKWVFYRNGIHLEWGKNTTKNELGGFEHLNKSKTIKSILILIGENSIPTMWLAKKCISYKKCWSSKQ